MLLRNPSRSFLLDSDGATMVEYAVMAALIATVCIATVASLGGRVLGLFSSPALIGPWGG